MAVSSKGKRKHIYNNETYYWFVRKNSEGIPRIHIISDDKIIHLERAMFDTEVPVTGCFLSMLTIKNYNPFNGGFLTALCANVCILCCEIDRKKREDAEAKNASDNIEIS